MSPVEAQDGRILQVPDIRLVDQTQVALKFAAGDDFTREQVSSTWIVRANRVGELFVVNQDLGGELAHISIHQDGRCHYKVAASAGRPAIKQQEWELPEPIDGDLVRLLTVVIPHRGLKRSPRFKDVARDTVLIPPPPPMRAIEVDVLAEGGPVLEHDWPGSRAMGSKLVGRISFYTESPAEAFWHYTVVATDREEPAAARAWSEAEVTVPAGVAAPAHLRTLLFGIDEVDGRRLPTLMEMPVGHYRG
jgi:hypothetical protein